MARRTRRETGTPPARHRRVAGEGEDDRGLPRAGLRRRGQRRAHPRPARRPSELPAEEKKGRFGKFAVDVDDDFEPYYVVDADKKKKVAELQAGAQGRRRALPRHRRGPRGRGHRLAPARRCSSPRCPSAGWSSTRSPATRSGAAVERHPRPRPATWSTPRRPAASSTGCTATRSRPVLWRKVRAGPVRRPRAVGRDPAGRRARAGADRVPLGVATGTSRRRWRSRRARATASTPGWSRSTAAGSPPAATSAGTASRSRASTASHLDEAAARGAGRRAARTPPFAVRSVEDKPYTPPPGGAVHDLDPAAGGQPQAAVDRADRDAGGAAAVRERLHHLHAHRLDDAVGVGARPRPGRRPRELYGAGVRARRAAPVRPRKVKNAQEAHEAIRPSGDVVPHARRRWPASCSRDELALYDLIWKRTVASQMADARGQTVDGPARRDRPATAGTPSSPPRGTVITFRGFLAAYEEGRDEDEARRPATTTASAGCRSWRAGDAARRCSSSSRTATRRTPPAALHRGHAWSRRSRSAASAARRPTPRSSARSSTAATSSSGHRAGADLARLRGRSACWRSTSAQLVDYDFTARDGGRPRPDRRRRGRPGRLAAPASTSATADGPAGRSDGLKPLVDDLGEIDARDINSRRRSATASCCGSAATGRTSSAPGRRGRPRRAACRRTWRPTS